MFKKEIPKQPWPEPATERPQTQEARTPFVEILKIKRREAMNEVIAMNHRIKELDGQIVWLEQYPQLEGIIESLRGS